MVWVVWEQHKSDKKKHRKQWPLFSSFFGVLAIVIGLVAALLRCRDDKEKAAKEKKEAEEETERGKQPARLTLSVNNPS